ncbi:MAG: DUF2142 domain-containing protein [Anaerolineae bacterium]|nr:DUF2142 domain-containing protein [Anaerolineae bacterium]
MKAAPLAVVLLAYALLGGLFAVLIPPWQNPDEPAHYNYVRQLAAGRLPVIEPTDWDATLVPIPPTRRDPPVERMTYEDHQPPLFYLLSLPAYWLSGGSLTALRLFALCVGGLSVVFAYRTAQAIFPEQHSLAAFTAAGVALLPQHLFILSGYNNDALALALIAAAVWQSVRLLSQERAPAAPALLALAVTVGLGLWTKATAYLTLPLAVYAALRAPAARAPDRLWRALLVGGAACLLAAPWWMRNLAHYGGFDFLGLQAHDAAVVGQPRTAEWIAQYGLDGVLTRLARTTFQSFWGQFGWMSVLFSERVYLALLGLTLLSATLFAAWWARESRALSQFQHRSLELLGLLALGTVLAFAWYNVQFVQHQGRYLYPALVSIALAVGLGWHHALGRLSGITPRLWLLATASLAGLNVYALWRVILPAMT